MKTVSGRVVSTQQIPLSKAAKYLAKFSSADNEESPAFAAYLRRTSAAFNELVQKHKEYKIPEAQIKVKKDHSSGVITVGTANSAKSIGKEIQCDVANVMMGLGVQNSGRSIDGNVAEAVSTGKKSIKKKGSDSNVAITGNVRERKNDMGSHGASEETRKSVPDVGGLGKKSKKNKGSDGDVAIVDMVQSHDPANANEVKNEVESLDASQGLKKKKKKKRDKHEMEDHKGALETVKEKQLRPQDDGVGEAADTAQNDGEEQKKHKKKSKLKEMKESDSVASTKHNDDRNVRNEVTEEIQSSIISAEQRSFKNVENKDEVDGKKKHKKNQSSEAEVREDGRSVETEAAQKKASRKRKHERVADGELNGSPEAVRPKKKKL